MAESKNTPKERRQVLAQNLRKRNLNVAIISNPKLIFYFTGFQSNLNMWIALMKGPRSVSFLAVDEEGEADLFLGSSEYKSPWPGLLKKSAKEVFMEHITEYPDYKLDERMAPYPGFVSREMTRWFESLRSRGMKFTRIGIEEWHLADIYKETISASFKDAKFAGISNFIDSMRLTKGTDELEHLKGATSMLIYAYGIAKENLAVGKTEMDLFREMNYHSFEKFGPFGEIFGDHVSGERSLGMAGGPTDRMLTAGDTIILDLQAMNNNYWSDLARTFVVGKPNDKQERVLQALIRAKEKAEELLIPGTRGKDIYKAVAQELVRSGYPSLPHHAGHGIGLDDQEAPWFIPNDESEIKSGTACVVEPGIYDPSTGGVRIEDAYLITKTGCEKISEFPIGLDS